MRIFSAFGLNWASDELCTGSFEESANAVGRDSDTIVVLEKGETLSASTKLSLGLYAVSGDEYFLDIPEIARYRITAKSIFVSALSGADLKAVNVFLMGSAMGVVLLLRGIFPLHGSTVCKPDGTAAVFCGHSGAGKSTIVAALSQQGISLVSDDVSAIKFGADGLAWVYPGLPRTKLWGSTLTELGLKPGNQIRAGIDKYYVELPLVSEPLRLTDFYELSIKQSGRVIADRIAGLRRIAALLEHRYRPSFVTTLGQQSAHMRFAASLAPQLQMTQISRPRNQRTLDDIIGIVKKNWA